MKRTYKAGLYLRLSKEESDKEESNSIESQRNILMRFLNNSDDMEYIDEYVDDGYTGTNSKRPGLQKMLANLERGIIDCIIVKALSRFGRNYLDVGKYVQQIFPQMNIRFVAINDNVDTKDEYENGFDMMLPIKNVFNESYSRDISRKVQSSFKAMQYAGLFTGAYCSYGYFIHQTHIRHFKIRKMDYGQNLLNILQTVTLRKLRQQFERECVILQDRCGVFCIGLFDTIKHYPRQRKQEKL